MRILILAAVLMLAGCMMTPQNVRDSKVSESITRPGKLSAVALCVTRGFDNQLQTQNNLRIDETAGIGEMIATEQGALFITGTGALYVVDFKQMDPAGTEVVYYIRGDVLTREHARNRIRGIVNGCG